MPNIKSAAKRMRQNVKRNESNRAQRAAMRTSVKKTRLAIAEGNAEAVTTQLPVALSSLGKMAQKGQIHKNKAARLTSRLAKAAAHVSKSKAV